MSPVRREKARRNILQFGICVSQADQQCGEMRGDGKYSGVRGPSGGRPARIMIEFQRGAFRVFTGCTEFRRGREGIPRREGQFRFTASWGALIPSALSRRRLSSPARREEFIRITLSSLYYRRRFKGNAVNADNESMFADEFSIWRWKVLKGHTFCTVFLLSSIWHS